MDGGPRSSRMVGHRVMHILVFNLVQAVVCIYAFVRGGMPERVTAVLLLVAGGATYLVPFDPQRGWADLRVPILLIDLALLCGLASIATFANRYWPIWISSLHLIAIAVHGIRVINPDFVPWMYGVAVGKIAYPMLLMLLIGTRRHRQRQLAFGSDRDWTPLRLG